MATSHDRVVTNNEELPHKASLSVKIPQSCGHVRSRVKWKTLTLHNHNILSHQTCQSNDISLGAPILKVTWPFNQVVSWGHVTKLNTLYLRQLQKKYGHQAKQGGDILWENSTWKSCGKFENCISTFTWLMDNRFLVQKTLINFTSAMKLNY